MFKVGVITRISNFLHFCLNLLVVLGIEPRALEVLAKHSATVLQPSP